MSNQDDHVENEEPETGRDGVSEEKRLARAQRPWWKMKRWWVAAPIIVFVAASSLESLLLYFLQRPILAIHANFEERYRNYVPNKERKYVNHQNKKTDMIFGYKYEAYFRSTNYGKSVKYIYVPPEKYISIFHNWLVRTGKANKVIATVRGKKISFANQQVGR